LLRSLVLGAEVGSGSVKAPDGAEEEHDVTRTMTAKKEVSQRTG